MRLCLVTLAIGAAILRRISSLYGRDLKMHPIPQSICDIPGLALPWGLSFVASMPIAGWRTADAFSWGIVNFNAQENTFGMHRNAPTRRLYLDVDVGGYRAGELAARTKCRKGPAQFIVAARS